MRMRMEIKMRMRIMMMKVKMTMMMLLVVMVMMKKMTMKTNMMMIVLVATMCMPGMCLVPVLPMCPVPVAAPYSSSSHHCGTHQQRTTKRTSLTPFEVPVA